MKNTNKVSKIPVFGLIAIITVIALTLIACNVPNDDDEDKGDGKTFTTLQAFHNWYGKQPDTTPDNPYRVKLNFKDVSMGFSGANFGLLPFERSKKYIYLDCSGSPFTSIESFSGCTNLTGITIPDSVTSIGSYTFSSCTNLINITIPNRVTSIGESAFENCTSLASIIIPNSVTSIQDQAFRYCTSLTSITIPDSVTYLSGFNDCIGLTDITIPNNVTTIGQLAFNSCTGLTSVTIPSNVIGIRAGAFGKTNLISVTFEGTISLSSFEDMSTIEGTESFPGDLRNKFYETDQDNGTPGTYTRPDTSSTTWTKISG